VFGKQQLEQKKSLYELRDQVNIIRQEIQSNDQRKEYLQTAYNNGVMLTGDASNQSTIAELESEIE
jgi:hypothetical protein